MRAFSYENQTYFVTVERIRIFISVFNVSVMNEIKPWGKIGAFLVMGISLIICSWILGHYWKRTHIQNETVKVTGLATKDFVSDLIVWRGNFSKKAPTLKEAYEGLKIDAG